MIYDAIKQMGERDLLNEKRILALERDQKKEFKNMRNAAAEAEKRELDNKKKTDMMDRNERVVFIGKQKMLRS